MFKIQKSPDRDFTVLNVGDPQLDYEVWGVKKVTSQNTMRITLDEIIPKVRPHLITVSGDFADEYGRDLYEYFIGYIDPFGVPWAPVMGNHDQEDGCDPYIVAELLKSAKNCLFDVGEREMGCGNYTVAVEENGKIVTAFIMMDSHRRTYITDEHGNEKRVMVPFTESQYRWYEGEVEKLTALGCSDSMLIFHIPLFEFRKAWGAAVKPGAKPSELLVWEPEVKDIWNDSYRDSFGINYEKMATHDESCPLFSIAKRLGHTKNILCAHDHGNNSSIVYEGIRLTYAQKTGCGGYFECRQNGATVITVGSEGVKNIRQEYVDLREMWLTKYDEN